jgi:uncharacterized protein (TIGR03435 family)
MYIPMQRFWILIGLSLCVATVSLAQTPAKVEFDAVAVHLSSAERTALQFDPSRIRLVKVNLMTVLCFAWNTVPYKVFGPDWLDTEMFDIEAVPRAGSTPAEWRGMLQTMLADRFGAVVHVENRVLPGYELVLARGGPKFGDAKSRPAFVKRSDPVWQFSHLDNLEAGVPGESSVGGHARFAGKQIPVTTLAEMLGRILKVQVGDYTGLSGTYDMNIYFDPNFPRAGASEAPPGDSLALPTANLDDTFPRLPLALREQLGLELNAKRVPVDVLVVDRISRKNTAN